MPTTNGLANIRSLLFAPPAPYPMNSSLRDQLLAAGLVTEKQARQAAQQEQQRQFRDRPRPKADQRPGSNQGQTGGQNRGAAQQGRPGSGSQPPQQAQAPSPK